MKWNESYALNVPIIDKQHKELFHWLDVINDSYKKGTTHAEIVRLLKFLVGYVKHHFAAEEEVMKIVSFPGRTAHQLLHKELIQALVENITRLKKNKRLNPSEVREFVTEWICNHIIKEDLKIRDFILKKKNESAFVANLTKIDSNNIISDIIHECNRVESLHSKRVLSKEDRDEQIRVLVNDYLHYFKCESLTELYDKKKVVDTLIEKTYLQKNDADDYWSEAITTDVLQSLIREDIDKEYESLILDSLLKDGVVSEEQYNNLSI